MLGSTFGCAFWAHDPDERAERLGIDDAEFAEGSRRDESPEERFPPKPPNWAWLGRSVVALIRPARRTAVKNEHFMVGLR